ncbi:EthD domain-containing protein [Nocardia sp. NPDC049220]|uniref:EthD domain-containing protein n=1 Tax=Nocardia sp. NPDC049220 TaxID=3155273 RepID=UPI0033EA0A97
MSEFLTRRSDFTREQFSEYWTNTHGPLLMSVPEVKKYCIRYVRQHNTGWTPDGVAPAPYDGVVEAWFENAEALQAIAKSENWDVMLADVENFADTSKTVVLFTTEEIIHQRGTGDPGPHCGSS